MTKTDTREAVEQLAGTIDTIKRGARVELHSGALMFLEPILAALDTPQPSDAVLRAAAALNRYFAGEALSRTPEPVADDVVERALFDGLVKRGIDQDTADQVAQAVAATLLARVPARLSMHEG